jgi:hypothetical protein
MRYCSRGETHIETRETPIDREAHRWTALPGEGRVPTCTEEGYGKIKCELCGEERTAEDFPALGHDQGEWHLTKEASCEASGARELRCTRCGEVLNTETIPALGHDYQNWVVTTPAACTTGVETGTCTHDNAHTTTRPIPAVHNYVNGICTVCYSIEMIPIAGGSFEMGKNLGTAAGADETPVHTVTLTGFSLTRYPVTQELYQAVMGSNPSYFQTAVSGESGTPGKLPVEKVSWYDALVFCNRLSVKEGLSPAYRVNGSTDPDVWGAVPTSSNDAVWDAAELVSGAEGYRLPTEAQWEYAARGETQVRPVGQDTRIRGATRLAMLRGATAVAA